MHLLSLIAKTTHSSLSTTSTATDDVYHIYEACLNAKSTLNSSNSNCFPKLKLNESDCKLNVLFNNLEFKTELIGKKISTTECSLSNHNVIINEMERRISDLANKLINLSSNLSKYVNYIYQKPKSLIVWVGET